MACFKASPLRGRTWASYPGGNLDGQAGGHQPRHARLQRGIFHRAQVHSGVFVGPVSIRGQDRHPDACFEFAFAPRYDNVLTPTKRVITVAPMPPEKSAYALARYSRSPDSIRDSIDWVRTHDSQKFLESFYFQYGHASIADLGHAVMCFEGISELAATEIEEEPLWDGQAKSSRYQDFSRSGFITPPELAGDEAAAYPAGRRSAARGLRAGATSWPSPAWRSACRGPADMKPDAYQRNLAARAFDVARYLLFWGVPTNVGQVASIRTLEKQIRRLKASEYAELRELGDEIAAGLRRRARLPLGPRRRRRAAGPHPGPPCRSR